MTTVSTHNNLPNITFGDDPISKFEKRMEHHVKKAESLGRSTNFGSLLVQGIKVQKVVAQFVKEIGSQAHDNDNDKTQLATGLTWIQL
ncbi:hypothetical protein COB21_02885 [Candidatus Aerophobetes bacterium]|uniref:Uncharacterized protein n=1 Tax=Aerophobetes bacterium TaxID=2030807 RepID=A0A2A4X5Y9_UNCAE|nr:MAG: hypothetical protein COB21_02885 [Candidatus Aerophobetes bacterium]